MSAFGSSAINKSNKKLAPKVPVQRRRPAAAALSQSHSQASARSSVEPSSAPQSSSLNENGGVQHGSTSTAAAEQPVAIAQSSASQDPVQSASITIARQDVSGPSDAPALPPAAVPSSDSVAPIVPPRTATVSGSSTQVPGVLQQPTPPSSQLTGIRKVVPPAEEGPSQRPAKRVRISPSAYTSSSAERTAAIEQGSTLGNSLSVQEPSSSFDTSQIASNGSSTAASTQPPQAGLDVAPLASTEGVTVSSTPIPKKRRTLPWATQSGDRVQTTKPASSKGKERADGADGSQTVEEDAAEQTANGPAKKPRKVRKDKGQSRKKPSGEATAPTENETSAAPRKPRRKRQPKPSAETAEDGSQGEGDEATADGTNSKARRRRRKRTETPEEMEDAEIAPDKVRMADLCSDMRKGKKSKLEMAMRQIDWSEVVRKRKETERQARMGEVDKDTTVNERLERADRQRNDTDTTTPQLRLVNGQLVIDQASLTVDRRAEASRNEDMLEEVEEDDLTTRINSQSWLYGYARDPTERGMPSKSNPWSELETDAFYDALRMFGTDFYIISKMFPGKTRRHIKLKFVREERSDPERVKAALLGEKVPMDLETFRAATGQELDAFKDPKELERELELENERHKEEIERQQEQQAELARQRRAAEQEAATGESSKENEGQQAGKGKKTTAKEKKRKSGRPIGGEEVEVLGLDE